MYKIYYTRESEENLAEIFMYILEDNSFYAAKVINSIKSTIDILKLFPLSWKSIDKDNRMIVESNHKYKIVYKLKDDVVYIVAVFKYKNILE